MERVVYADVLWLIDFCMDLLALGLAGRMTGRAARPLRLIVAAAVGGLWSVAALLLGLDGGVGLLLDLAVALGMLTLAFGVASWRRSAATLGCFVGAGILLGGSMTALANLVGPAESEMTGGRFVLLALGSAALTALATYLRRRAIPHRVEVSVTVADKTLTLTGIPDSGNLVRDPITGRSVVFLSPTGLRRLLDPPLRTALLTGRLTALPPDDARRVCLVPMTTVQGRSMRPAVRPDRVTVDGESAAALIAAMATDSDAEAIVPAELVPQGAHNIGRKVKP